LVDQVRVADYHITRFEFARDRIIGDSQVRITDVNVAAIELIDSKGQHGLGFTQSLFHQLPPLEEIERVFETEVWPKLKDQLVLGLIHRVSRPRGGNQRRYTLPFEEAIQVALWDLAAKQADIPLHEMLGSRRNRVRAYASGLDFHLSDSDFVEFFGHADSLGYEAFKIKVGHPDFDRDLHRLALLKKTVRPDALVMIDANEAWGVKESITKIEAIQRTGTTLLWVEDPVLRNDFDGLALLRQATPNTQINSGEYLDVTGKRQLLAGGCIDMLNVHGQVTDVMHIGWLAAEFGIPVTLGNTFLEFGIHLACALPEVEWLEYSFQNLDHLVEAPISIAEGWAYAPDRPGHGLVLSEHARREWARPSPLSPADLGPAPLNPRVANGSRVAAGRM
jgi:L-alanine-DL-glutamate epimerase-like enolase superfamily enzyme